MKLCSTRIVRIPTGDQATPTGRTTADTQVSVIKTHALGGHLVEVRSLGDFTAVTTQVIPRDVVRDKKDEIGLFSLGDRKQTNSRKENEQAFHNYFKSEIFDFNSSTLKGGSEVCNIA
jgi:hypothetical protein